VGPRPEGQGSSCSGVVASKLDTRPELTGLFEGVSFATGRRTEVRGPVVAAPEGGVTGEWLRLELRDRVTEVMESRVLRVVERRRSGERRSGALRGSFLATWPPKWLGRSGGQLTVAIHRSGVLV
jgi:hypothetical protein